MPLSLLTLLASRACHADTLKRALAGDEDARRLLARLGIGPTHLDDMRRGSAERLRAAKPASADIRTQAAFEQQLAEADEHVRVVEKRLVNAAAFEREMLTLLGVDYTCQVPDAIRALRNRAESAAQDPIADLAILTGRPVRVWRNPTGPDEWRFGAHIESYCDEHGATAYEALSRMLDSVRRREMDKATLPKPEATEPPEPIVLGPWRCYAGMTTWYREFVGEHVTSLHVSPDGWAAFNRMGCHLFGGDEAGEESKAAADRWARENGYVLLDAEPGSEQGILGPWMRVGSVWLCRGGHALKRTVSVNDLGWRVNVGCMTLAFGPQTGEEGKRLALAAAHALGLTGGGE